MKSRNGSLKTNLTVRLSGIWISWVLSCSTPALAPRYFSKVNFTSSGVTGEPSWNLMPGRSLNVADLLSGATSYDSARLGANGLPGRCLTSASCRAYAKLYGVIWGGFSCGSSQAGEIVVCQA